MEARQWMMYAAMAIGMLSAGAEKIHARPHYSEAFRKAYEKEFSGNTAAADCTVCHFGPVKRSRNDYGMAVTKALKVRNERDAAEVRKALEEAAKQPSAVKGKTFGDLIKEGKLPGKAPIKNPPQQAGTDSPPKI